MAREKGFYKDEGLDVNIFEYDNMVDLSKSVTQNQHAFAVGYSGSVLDAINANDIVLLSAIFQSSPYVLVSLKSSGIKSIKDFKNKRIMIDSESKQNTAFISMLHANGISFEDMNVSAPTFKVDSLINKEIDIAAWYLSNEVYLLEKQGIEFDVWNPKDYGFDFYNDLLFTSKKELQDSPELVESFRNASLKGWEYAFAHIDETVDIIVKKYNTQNKSEGALLYEARVLKKLTYINDKKLGVIEKDRIQRLLDIYNLLGFYKNDGDLDALIYKTSNKFSLTQNEKRYLEKKKVLKMCVNRKEMPFEGINEDNQHVGIVADIFKVIQKNTHLEFEVVPMDNWTQGVALVQQNKCDIFAASMQTPSHKKYMNFSTPYLSFPFVIATKNSEMFIDNIEQLDGKTVSIVQDSSFVELLTSKYPHIKTIEVATLMQGLQLVREGKVYGHIDPIASLAYTLRQEGVSDLKIAGKFNDFFLLSIATRVDEPLLKLIMQKAIDSVEAEELTRINNNWLAIKFEEQTNYVLVYEMLGILLLFGSLGMWRYYEIHKINKIIRHKNEELNKAYKQYSWLAENMDDVVWVMNIDGKFIYMSPSVEKLRGFSVEEVMAQTFEELICEQSREAVVHAMQAGVDAAMRGEVPPMQLLRVAQPCKDGSLVWTEVNSRLVVDEHTGEMRFIGLTRDITKSIAYEEDLERIAITDQLTNIFNRRKLNEIFQVNKDLADRYGTTFGVVMIDIDHFKSVNDLYGHKIGDLILQTFASLMLEQTRNSDIVGRWGGEEFLIILPHATEESIMTFSENLRMKIQSNDFEVVGNITASFGATLYHRTESYDEAVSRADKALYISKEAGRNRVTFLGAT
jgi:diguanylate cyclase (GGDEF)-like protein/PAS domain S-box-containing protein